MAQGTDVTRSRWRILTRLPFPSLIFLVFLPAANSLIALPYSVLSPGQATSVTSFIKVQDHETFDHAGNVLFTTVNVRQQAHPFDVFWAWIFPGEDLEKRDQILGDATPEEYIQQNEQAMDASKLAATTVAMNRAGYKVTLTGKGAQVQQLAEGSPVDGLIKPGEVIKSVNGENIEFSQDLTTRLQAMAAGTELTLSVQGANDELREVKVKAGARPNDATRAYLGVVITTYATGIETPFPVDIETEKVGGPSAGLAFTLALLDQLTPGNLTGGGDVAVTGTISVDGTVGPVGGVKQKAGAVNKTGAKLFLVPSDEFEEASAAADSDVKVEKVDTLQQALDALGRNGGDLSGLPAVPADTAA